LGLLSVSRQRAVLLGGIALTVLAAMLGAQEPVAFRDDFAQYAAGSDAVPTWQGVAGQWTVQDGAYVQSLFRTDEMTSFLRAPVVSDFTFSARFRVYPEGAGVRAAGLVFRSQNSRNGYFAHYDSRHSQVLLYVQVGDAYKELARVKGVPIEPEQWHTGKVVCKGPGISVYLDDKLLCERQDDTYAVGRVGVRTAQGKISFDDVAVQGVSAKLDKEWVIVPGSIKPNEDSVPRLTAAEHIVAERGGGYFPVLIKLQDGRLAAVVRGGDPHIGIKGRLDWLESGDGGKTWSAPRVIVDSEWDDRNPSFGQMADGTIVLGYTECQAYNAEKKWDMQAGGFVFYYMTSKDGGKTWSEKRPLARGPIGNDASPYGRIIVLQDGLAIMSIYGDVNRAYTGPDKLPAEAGRWICGLLRSRDNGETWGDFSLISSKGHNETSLLELADGTLLAALRTSGGMVDQAVSTDGGRTWSEPLPVTGGPGRKSLQHPADLVRLQSGNLLLVYGNRLEPFGMEAILSADRGKTWGYDQRVLLGWNSLNTDCGYPSAVQLDDGTLVCMYYSVGTEDLPDEQALVVRFTEAQLRQAGGF
jgi:hypothetical protein